MRKNSFVIYTDCLEQLEVIPDAERGVLFLEVLKYARTGVVPTIENPFLKALFLGFKNQIDRDTAKYDEVCKKRAEAGRNGGNQRVANLKIQATQSNCNQNQANASNCLKVEANASNTQANQADSVNGSVNVYDIDINKSKGKTSRFTPPTLQEVENYIKEKGYSVDAEAFIAFYDSNGWLVGKNKMKSWKSAVTTWAKREEKQPQRQTNTTNNVNSILGKPNKRDRTKHCNDEWK